MLFIPLLKGFLTSGGLIMALGAQNVFVLRQGIKKHHLFLTAMTCFICDSILIILGVKGIGLFITDFPFLDNILRWGGALFLLVYGCRSLHQVFKPQTLLPDETGSKRGKLATLMALLAFTLLNPHTYIDTFLIIGSVGGQAPYEEHFPFILGALSASLLWFFSLTYGASSLSGYFKRPHLLQGLDFIIGVTMIGIAICLIY